MDKKAETRISGGVLIGALVVVVIAVFIGFLVGGGKQQPSTTIITTTPPITPTGGVVVTGCTQQTDGTNTINSALRNELNSSLEYLAASVAVEYEDGSAGPTGTLTGGTSLTKTALDAVPCKKGYLYVIGSTTIAGTKIPIHSFEMTKDYEITGARSTYLAWVIRNNALSNLTSDTAAQSPDTQSDTSIASGGTVTFYLDGQVNTGSKTFGYVNPTKSGNLLPSDGSVGDPDGISTPSDGVLYAFDLSTSKFSKSSGVALQGPSNNPLTKLSECPSDLLLLYSSSDVCYTGKTLTAGDGMQRYTVTAQADLGEPGITDDIYLRTLDKTYFRDTDGKIKLGYVDSAGTDAGAGNSVINISVA